MSNLTIILVCGGKFLIQTTGQPQLIMPRTQKKITSIKSGALMWYRRKTLRRENKYLFWRKQRILECFSLIKLNKGKTYKKGGEKLQVIKNYKYLF